MNRTSVPRTTRLPAHRPGFGILVPEVHQHPERTAQIHDPEGGRCRARPYNVVLVVTELPDYGDGRQARETRQLGHGWAAAALPCGRWLELDKQPERWTGVENRFLPTHRRGHFVLDDEISG